MRENFVDMDIMKPKPFFLDENITNTHMAMKIQKLKLVVNAFKKSKMVKAQT